MANALKLKTFAHSKKVLRLGQSTQLTELKKFSRSNVQALTYHIERKSKVSTARANRAISKEQHIITAYSNIYSSAVPSKQAIGTVYNTLAIRPTPKISPVVVKEKRGYIKHMVRLRYR